MPEPHVDERGFFCRTYEECRRRAPPGSTRRVRPGQPLAVPARGVVRGMHVRRGAGEAKLVRCSYGAVFDVVVDLRPDSPTYRNWESFDLDGSIAGHRSTCRPGCAHGFQALTEPADVSYRIDRLHDPAETSPSPLTTRSWPSRGQRPSRSCPSATSGRCRWPRRCGCWAEHARLGCWARACLTGPDCRAGRGRMEDVGDRPGSGQPGLAQHGGLPGFSEPTRAWFTSAFAEPTPAQAQAWEAIERATTRWSSPRPVRARRWRHSCGRSTSLPASHCRPIPSVAAGSCTSRR